MSNISQTVNRIIDKRQKDIKPKYDGLWEKVMPYIKMACSLERLIWDENCEDYNEDFQALLNSNNEFKRIFAENEETVRAFVNHVKNHVGWGNSFEYSPKGSFEAVHSRVSKSEVEICVMGPVSTGKSVLMQGLTGAPQYVLPTGTGKTTAARTVFRNITNSSAIGAKISFYSVQDFKEQVFNDFIRNLNIAIDDYNKTENATCENLPEWNGSEDLIHFCSNSLLYHSSFQDKYFTDKQITGVNTKIGAKEYFKTFKELYVEKVSDYAPFLGNPDKPLNSEDIEKGRLIPYVSYKEVATDDCVKCCLALAVEEVTIDWPLKTFDNQELGRISLVDTMGIGEPKFSVEESLLNIIRKRADLAIALCKIENDKDNFESKHDADKKFLSVLSKLKDRKPESWIYYLANKQANANISEDIARTFKDQLWDYMVSGADGFSLNKNHWKTLEFLSDTQTEEVNSKDIIDYFVNTVLSNLENDIEKIDDDFICQAEKDYNNTVVFLDKLNLLFNKLDNIGIDVSDKDTLLDDKSNQVMKNITDELIKLRDTLSKENDEHCKKIMDEIYPLLCEPELFKILGISTEEKKNYFKKFESKEGDNLKIFEDTNYREYIIFLILSQLNDFRVDKNKHKSSFDDAIAAVLSQFKDSESHKENFEAIKAFTEEEFFKDLYEETGKKIEDIQNEINPQTDRYDEKNKTIYRNELGRELQYFYQKREELLFGITGRLNENAGDTEGSLNKYFKDKTEDVIKRVCQAIGGVLKTENILQDTTTEYDSQWLMGFAQQSKGKKLVCAIERFLNTEIKLNVIVTDKQANILLDNLCTVELKYNNSKDAAYSFFACLFYIDRQLRYTLWRMYIDTFKKVGIYSPTLTDFYNSVFCAYIHHKDSKEYGEFKGIVRRLAKKQFDCSDEGRISRAVDAFDNCYDILKQIKH